MRASLLAMGLFEFEYRQVKKTRKTEDSPSEAKQSAARQPPERSAAQARRFADRSRHIIRESRVSRMHSTPIMLTAAAIDTYAPTHGKPPRAASICAIYGATDAPRIPPRLYDTPAPV